MLKYIILIVFILLVFGSLHTHFKLQTSDVSKAKSFRYIASLNCSCFYRTHISYIYITMHFNYSPTWLGAYENITSWDCPGFIFPLGGCAVKCATRLNWYVIGSVCESLVSLQSWSTCSPTGHSPKSKSRRGDTCIKTGSAVPVSATSRVEPVNW